jgi:hypothetical protein
MPIFVEWKWMEETETFLVVFHFWDDRKKPNLRMRVKEEGFETCGFTAEEQEGAEFVPIETFPYYMLSYPDTNAYLSWAPSHSEFCFLTEILTYANLINGIKPPQRRKLRWKLQGKTIKEKRKGRELVTFEIHVELLRFLPEGKGNMVSFIGQDGISFEVCLEYIEYLRMLIKPYLS